RLDCDLGVGAWRRQHVDDVGPSGPHLRKARKHAGNGEAGRHRTSPVERSIGDAHDADMRECLQRADVVRTDVPRTHQRDTSFLPYAHGSILFFCPILRSTMSTTVPTRASHVMVEVASTRRLRSASVSLTSAASIWVMNCSGPRAIRTSPEKRSISGAG